MRGEKGEEGGGEDLSWCQRDHCSGMLSWYHFINYFPILLKHLLHASAVAGAFLPNFNPCSFLENSASEIEFCLQGTHVLQAAGLKQRSNLSPEEQPGSPLCAPALHGEPQYHLGISLQGTPEPPCTGHLPESMLSQRAQTSEDKQLGRSPSSRTPFSDKIYPEL